MGTKSIAGAVFFLSALMAPAQSVLLDGTPIKKGCGVADEVIDSLPAGAAVEIRSGIGGCYFVTVKNQGKVWYGFLPGSAFSGSDRMENERRAAPSIGPAAARLGPPPVEAPKNANAKVNKAIELLGLNQPKQAFDLLEAELKENEKDSKFLALTGIAAYRADDLSSAITYLKQSLDIEKDTALESLYKKVLKEFGSSRTMKTLIGSRAQLRYLPGAISEADAHALLELVDHEYTRVSGELGCSSSERVTAIVQDLVEYRKSADAAEWSAGQFDGRIRVALLEPGPPTDETRQTFAHEVVHACLANIGPFPAWLHEGLAQRLSGKAVPPAMRARVREAARANTIPRLNNMSQTWSRMSPDHAVLAYATAFEAVDLFFAKFKEFGIRNLLMNPERLPEIADQLDKLLKQ